MPDGIEAGPDVYRINQRLEQRLGGKDYLSTLEGVVREYPVSIGHPDMKRAFVRMYYLMASQVNVISVIGRSKLGDEVITLVEKQMREQLEQATNAMNEDIAACSALMQSNGISGGRTLAPLRVTVSVTSPLMRRYLDLILKCDQLETMLDTLTIEDIITPSRSEEQKRKAKKFIRQIPGAARQWVAQVRAKMQEVDEERERADAEKAARKRGKKSQAPVVDALDEDGDLEEETLVANEAVAAGTGT